MRAVNPYGYDSVQGVYTMVEKLINAHADVNVGNTALSFAVEFNQHNIEGNAEVIRLLLSKGAKTQVKGWSYTAC
jgi:ankyrin repeat protein